MLQTQQVEKKFGNVTAVNRVSLRIPKGQMVGVIGTSGAGKSTFLRLLNRLIDPSRGKIYFDGIEVSALRGTALRQWRSRCAMIFQQFNLVNRLDVITNVLVGRLGQHGTLSAMIKKFTARERAMGINALDRLDMECFALQRADTLSGGQQQRVAIARALVQNPHLVLADEPIASLDPHNAAKVMEALRTINQEDGITVICNLHQVSSAKNYCDRILGMSEGEVIFDGKSYELTDDKAREIYGGARSEEELEQALDGVSAVSGCNVMEPVADVG